MSGGWIKFEKDLRDDVRVLRMATALTARYPEVCNAGALHPVTLVLGGLAKLWMHADSFARDDDTLDITPDEVDQIAGIKGFAQILPADWLEVLDPQCVKLPGFQDHNGTDAKRRALTAKRVAKHRGTHGNSHALQPQVTGNASALPDQTRPDHLRKNARAHEAARAAPGSPTSALTVDQLRAARESDPAYQRRMAAANASAASRFLKAKT